MCNLLVDERDQRFVLYEVLDVEKLCDYQVFADYSKEIFDMVLTEAHKLAETVLAPTYKEGDEEGCKYDPDTREVHAPKCHHSAYQKLVEGGWIGICQNPDVGGQGFPLTLGIAVSELFYSACFGVNDCSVASAGIGNLIELYGTDEQKEKYLERVYGGEWGGTMCLTEPCAGSDVGALQTKAVKHPDGTYRISGAKHFITRGEFDLTENIVHTILARIEGDPPGTKGLSIFIVPKFLVNDDGSLGKRNDVFCSGIEHKMGQHAVPTNSMVFGDDGNCVGYLLGEERQGIQVMFNMMNEARLFVGLQGLALSSKAFLNAVDYTKTRIQGVPPTRTPNAKRESAPIIQHPDVRRMLLWMKTYVEGCRGLTYFVNYCIDQSRCAEDTERSKWEGLIDLLTPIIKAYNTDRAWEITATAIQCAGGYGYCSEYPFEQIARDSKAASLYEGTNGIQAMDLLLRKLIKNRLSDFDYLNSTISSTINAAKEIAFTRPYAEMVEKAMSGLVSVVNGQMKMAEQGKNLEVYYTAAPFLEAMGDVMLGWIHLWQMTVAHGKLEDLIGDKPDANVQRLISENNEIAFYHGKVISARFYIGTILKRTAGKFEQIMSDETAVMEINENSFAR